VSAAYLTAFGTTICVETASLTEENAKNGKSLATLVNKRREKFRLDVANKLTLTNIKIDSLDSVLMSKDGLIVGSDANTCLKERKNCCGAFSDQTDAITGKVSTSLANAEPTDTTFSCNDAFTALKNSFEFDCYANWPDRAMFEMRVNDPTLFEIR